MEDRLRWVVPVVVTLAAACDGPSAPEAVVPPPIVVTVVPSVFEVEEGKTVRLTASVTDQSGSASTIRVTWSTNDPSVVTVDDDGRVTGHAPGRATVTASARSTDARTASASSSATVKKVVAEAGGAIHPNEPAGFTAVADRGFQLDGERGWRSHAGFYTEDPTAPFSGPDVVQMTWPAGTGANAAGNATKKDIAVKNEGELYVHVVFKYSPNWVPNPNSENSKFIGWNGGTLGGALRPALVSQKGTAPDLRFQIDLQDTHTRDPKIVSTSLRANLSLYTPDATQWTHMEVYLKLNGPSDDNGVVSMWLWNEGGSPVKVMHHDRNTFWGKRTPGKLIGSDDQPVWRQLRFSGIWGGKGGVIPQNQWIRFDHYYASVR